MTTHKTLLSLVAISVAAVSINCADDDVDSRITNPMDNNEGYVDEVPKCEAEDRDYASLDARFPWAGDQRFYRLSSDEYCNTTGSVLLEVTEEEKLEDVKVMISPHAGWQFSGLVTATLLSRVDLPELIILIGNNHKDNGEKYAVYPDGAWALPTGDIPVDAEVAQKLIDAVPDLVADKVAHSEEHSNEVQTMWLSRFKSNLRIVPISFDYTNDVTKLQELGRQIAAALKDLDEDYLVIATTDLTHYQPLDVVKERDDLMIEQMVDMDPVGLFELVHPERSTYSMCGLEPTIVGMTIAEELGATTGEVIKRRTSFEGNGNDEQVVGYVGIAYR